MSQEGPQIELDLGKYETFQADRSQTKRGCIAIYVNIVVNWKGNS